MEQGFLLTAMMVFMAVMVDSQITLSPVVTTNTGGVRGKLVEITEPADRHQDVYEFTGIPFAEPPVGQRRFKKPVPKTPWTDIFDATRLAKACIQFDGGVEIQEAPDETEESEDCLLLNVWVPKATLINATAQLPVYVFIHGGSFICGAISEYYYNGGVLASYQNIVVVTIQYRLGPLGFAYFGKNDDAPGNAGLWDQLEALKWINANIAAFGGDPRQVTIGGESAGAAAVTYHLLSPYSRPYFQRAIVQSGSAIGRWAKNTEDDAASYTDVLLRNARCGSRINKRTPIATKISCLRSLNAKAIVRYSSDLNDDESFAPVIEGDFVPKDPNEMLTSGLISKFPLLIGFNRDEGHEYYQHSPEAERIFESGRNLNYNNYNKLVEIACELAYGEDDVDPAICRLFREHYRPPQANRSSVIDAAMQIVGDYGLTCPTYVWGNYTASFNVPVFAYHFSQRFKGGFEDLPEWAGAFHAIELPFVFGSPFADYAEDGEFTEVQKIFSQKLMQFWGNFIKTGNPGQVSVQNCGNGTTGNANPSWQAYVGNQCGNAVMELNIDTVVYSCRQAVSCHFKENDCSFWQDHFMYED